MQSWVDLPCFDGVYTFKLGPAQISEIQAKRGTGIGKVYARTIAGRHGFGDGDFLPDLAEFDFSDLVEIIRQGLIGGKHAVVDDTEVLITSTRANELISNYVLDGQERMVLVQTWALAANILDKLMHGYVPPVAPKKKRVRAPRKAKAPSTTPKRSPTRQ